MTLFILLLIWFPFTNLQLKKKKKANYVWFGIRKGRELGENSQTRIIAKETMKWVEQNTPFFFSIVRVEESLTFLLRPLASQSEICMIHLCGLCQ